MIFQRVAPDLIEVHLIEVKSEYAVKQATGANQIIRQYNKMRRYFFEDLDRNVPEPGFDEKDIALVFHLDFIPSVYNLLHLLQNQELYNQCISTPQNEVSHMPYIENPTEVTDVEISLNFVHPLEPYKPVALATSYGSTAEPQMLLPPEPSKMDYFSDVDKLLATKLKTVLKNQS